MEHFNINDQFRLNKNFNNNNNNIQNFTFKKNINQSNKQDILRILISIYYHEKFLLKDYIYESYIQDNHYYLINPDWINKFKNNYNYQEIYRSLKIIDNNNQIHYTNLNNFIDDIMQGNEYINFQNEEKLHDLLYLEIKAEINKCYIIHSNIMDLIKKFGYWNSIDLLVFNILKKENNTIYLINNNNCDIIIGKINNNLILFSEYILHYETPDILNREKYYLLNYSIEDYKIYRNCNNNSAKEQLLITENNEIIGKLTTLPNKIKNKNHITNQPYNNFNTNINYNDINFSFKNNNRDKNWMTNYNPFILEKQKYKSKPKNKIFINSNTYQNFNKKNKNSSYNKSSHSYNKKNKTKDYISLIKQRNIPNNEDNLVAKNNKINNKNEQNIIIKYKNKINQLTKIINQIKQENEKIKLIYKNKENELFNKNKEFQNLLNHLHFKDDEIKQLENKNNVLFNNPNNVRNELSKTQKNFMEIKKLKEQNISRDNNEIIRKLKHNINNLKKENEQKEYTINNLINNNNKNDNFKNILNDKEKEINNLKEILEKNNREEEKYKKTLLLKDKEILELKKQNQKIQKELDNQMKLNDTYIKRLNNLQNELNEIKRNNNFKSIKEDDLNRRIMEIAQKEKEFNKKMNFLEDKENQIEKERLDLQKLRENLQEDIELNKKIKNENNYLNIKNKELDNEINKIMNNNKQLNNNNFNSISNQNNINEANKRFKQEQDIIKKSEPIFLYLNPTLVGLNNIGATCFMNATLQCLSQTEALTNYFLKEKNNRRIINNNIAIKNKNNLQLSPAYLELVNILWKENGPKSYSPYNFMNIINEMNPLFKRGLPGDSKDFIIFILEQLHKELKKSVNFNNNNININESLNQYNKNNAFNHFFKEFQKDTSIISDVFFGFTETTNECLYCKINYNSKGLLNPICYNYGIFNCLIFPLEEVKRMKNNSMIYNNYILNNNNRVSLRECFIYNQNSEYFTGQNQNYCNICKQLFDSIYTSRIYVSPNVLVLILNRGKGNVYNVKLDFTETIDITEFVLRREMTRITYDLYGVITHIGQSGPNAHFIASCKSPVDKKWYRYNDAIVSHITNIKKDIIDFGTPYILFYKKNQIK